MDVFIYWDNSNIFHEAQRIAEEHEAQDGPGARYRVRIDFDKLLRLANADRPMKKALAVGSVPPEMSQLWNRLSHSGVEVSLYDRGEIGRGEQEVPDRILQLRMLEDGYDNNGNTGTIVLLTGDGKGYEGGTGFHSTLERLHKRGWKVEILSWSRACNRRMQQWAEENGIFIALDDFYDSITFMNPSGDGHAIAPHRPSTKLDLSKRKIS